jgi:uncharacterized protein (TIGR00369 family)
MSYRDDPELLESLHASFRATPLHALLRLEYIDGHQPGEVDTGTAVVRMPVHPDAYGASGNLHGGAIATLIDVAAASAAARNSAFVPGENTLVTADIHVRYLGRPKGAHVDAHAHVVRAGRQLIVVECRVVDAEDRVIAVADFSSMVVPLRGPLPGAAHDPASPEL